MKPIAIILVFIFLLNTTAFAADTEMYINSDGRSMYYDSKPIRLFINNQEMQDLPMPPIIYNNYTLVPAREVFEPLGAVVDWKPDVQEVFIAYKDRLIILQIDSEYASVDGNYVNTLVPAKIINSKTMIPLRFVSEAIGLGVEWNEELRSAFIFEKEDEVIQPTVDDTTDSGYRNDSTLSDGSVAGGILVPDSSAPPAEAAPQPDALKYVLTDISSAPIETQQHPEAVINTMTLAPSPYEQVYILSASQPISRIDKQIINDDKLVIDIHNAQYGLEKTEYLTETSSIVAKIRGSQFQVEPYLIARVVFDMQSSTNYSLTLSPDRKQLVINFGSVPKNKLNKVEYKTDGVSDYFYMYCDEEPTPNISTLTNPDRISVELKLTELGAVSGVPVNGVYSSAISFSQVDQLTTQMIINLTKLARYDITINGSILIVKVAEPTYKNILYDYDNRVIRLKKPQGMNIGAIAKQDQYHFLRFVFTLPGNYKDELGYGDYLIRDDYLSFITIQNNQEGLTEIVVHENQVLAYNITENNEYIYIKPVKPREKYNKIVVVDPGHGGTQPGTNGFGTDEKVLNMDIALRLIRLLEADEQIKVYSTRLTDITLGLGQRTEFANALGDLMVVIHINSGDKNLSANGIETFYAPHENDTALGFSSQDFSKIVHKHLLNDLGAFDRTVKKSEFYISKYTKIPTAYCEVGFITNQAEAAKLLDANYREKIAQAMYKGIAEGFQRYSPKR